MPVEVVTAAQRLSVIYTLKGCGGEGARVDRDHRLPVHWREQRSKPRSKEFKFQLGGPSLHIIRPRSERHSSLISLRLAGFPCALSTATPRRSAPIQSRGQIYACMPQVEPHLLNPTPSTYRAARRLGLPLSFSSFLPSFKFTGIGQPAT